jgi:hypothetical protein
MMEYVRAKEWDGSEWVNAEAFDALLAAAKALIAFDSRAYVKQSELARDLLAAKKPVRIIIAKVEGES